MLNSWEKEKEEIGGNLKMNTQIKLGVHFTTEIQVWKKTNPHNITRNLIKIYIKKYIYWNWFFQNPSID